MTPRAPLACSVDGCESPASRRGWCLTHYTRWYRTGQLQLAPRPFGCAVEGCNRRHCANGFCALHAARVRRTGTPERPTRLERLWRSITVTDRGCWQWTGTTVYGYAQATIGGRKWRLHRWFYEAHVGPIPEGLQIDHLCRNRACVNPGHLEAVTPRVNTLRSSGITAANAAKTHCIRGHEFTPENTTANGHPGRRACRECRRTRDRLRPPRTRTRRAS